MTSFITLLVVRIFAFTVVMIVLSRVLLRRILQGSKGKQQQAAELFATGAKARAQIVALAPTGTVINEIYIRTVVRFEITPLDGSPRFDGEKKMTIDQTTQPPIGDTWPCWYDRQDRTVFAVGQPSGDARQQIEIFREFGIPHPLDQS